MLNLVRVTLKSHILVIRTGKSNWGQLPSSSYIVYGLRSLEFLIRIHQIYANTMIEFCIR